MNLPRISSLIESSFFLGILVVGSVYTGVADYIGYLRLPFNGVPFKLSREHEGYSKVASYTGSTSSYCVRSYTF